MEHAYIGIDWSEGDWPALTMEDACAALREGEELPFGAHVQMTWRPEEERWEFNRDAGGNIIIDWRKR